MAAAGVAVRDTRPERGRRARPRRRPWRSRRRLGRRPVRPGVRLVEGPTTRRAACVPLPVGGPARSAAARAAPWIRRARRGAARCGSRRGCWTRRLPGPDGRRAAAHQVLDRERRGRADARGRAPWGGAADSRRTCLDGRGWRLGDDGVLSPRGWTCGPGAVTGWPGARTADPARRPLALVPRLPRRARRRSPPRTARRSTRCAGSSTWSRRIVKEHPPVAARRLPRPRLAAGVPGRCGAVVQVAPTVEDGAEAEPEALAPQVGGAARGAGRLGLAVVGGRGLRGRRRARHAVAARDRRGRRRQRRPRHVPAGARRAARCGCCTPSRSSSRTASARSPRSTASRARATPSTRSCAATRATGCPGSRASATRQPPRWSAASARRGHPGRARRRRAGRLPGRRAGQARGGPRLPGRRPGGDPHRARPADPGPRRRAPPLPRDPERLVALSDRWGLDSPLDRLLRPSRGPRSRLTRSAHRRPAGTLACPWVTERLLRPHPRRRPRRRPPTTSSTCSSSAWARPVPGSRWTPRAAGCGSRSSTRATSPAAPAARAASSCTAGCATWRTTSSAWSARASSSGSCCMRLAPHLVRPMDFLYPVWPDTARRRLLGLGLTTYDVFAFAAWCGGAGVRRHERISAERGDRARTGAGATAGWPTPTSTATAPPTTPGSCSRSCRRPGRFGALDGAVRRGHRADHRRRRPGHRRGAATTASAAPT